MNKIPDILTIQGETYIKQTGPSKKEIEAAENLFAKSRKISSICAFSLATVFAIASGSVLAWFMGFFLIKMSVSMVYYFFKIKNHVSKEALKIVAATQQTSDSPWSYCSPNYWRYRND